MDRAFILEEVQRCAAENGGIAPGRERFERDTGIKEGLWRGKYWARWSDLLSEAGFVAGSMNAALDRDSMLVQLCECIEEMGRVPTAPDMRLRKRTHPSFPNDKTVGNRFGYGAKLAAAVLEYAEGKPGLELVVEICRPAARKPSTNPLVKSSGVRGVVYLMKSGRYYKIGRSNSAGRRLYEIGIQLPERVDMVHVFETDDPEGIERYWHERFAAKRRNGEWFDLAAEDVAAFKRRKAFM